MLVTDSIRTDLSRQITHWNQAILRLSALDHLASQTAWQGTDYKIGQLLKNSLQQNVKQVIALGNQLKQELEYSGNDTERLRALRQGVLVLRQKYLRAEETIQFYTVAINSRTTPLIAALLRACDILCTRSMEEILRPLGKETPPILTYIDKGAGASILKAGLRLWDGNISPVAAVKITQHNLFRPTAIIHETGHQVAHILGWNEELANALRSRLINHQRAVGEAFAGWASEIAADAFSFVHAGFGSVAALHDVVSSTRQAVFYYNEGDPHPISYIRVLLNIEFCRRSFGAGPWDEMEQAFRNEYDIDRTHSSSIPLIRLCKEAIPDVANLVLNFPLQAFGNRTLSQLIPPERVSPQSLQKLEFLAGPALFTSHAWIWSECIRLLALNSYKIGTGKGDLDNLYKQQEQWMLKLGYSVAMN
ncbi:hypothetical protein [Salinimicrobium sp. TH3]|uniref:hypothetical protein n=1 Tax=Salinimicrobium sp. TH3 TaxID=2997342 RepID=UPI002276B52F|nr:hypothetical protein [Salinimicrobium sp. TH3]MCY2687586.1 hypothetical protein [Salinimicrobium sp. TH3]